MLGGHNQALRILIPKQALSVDRNPTPYSLRFHHPHWLRVAISVPGEAHASADPVGVPQDPRGDDVAQGLQHVLQLLLIHGYGEVGDVQVGGVLLLLLWVTRRDCGEVWE